MDEESASEYPRKTNPYTYLNMNDTQKMKSKLRNSKAWKDKRKKFKKEFNKWKILY